MTDVTPQEGEPQASTSVAPATSTALILTPPDPVTAIAPAQAAEAVPVDPAAAQRIDTMVSGEFSILAACSD